MSVFRNYFSALLKNRKISIFDKYRSVRSLSSDTIFSLSSGYGKCGVFVIRVSGPKSLDTIKSVANFKDKPKSRYAYLRRIHHPKTQEIIDKGLVLWFPGPNSYTGEDCCEFQLHGSVAVLQAMFEALGSISGLRMAQPGEYTKRSFLNGKLDLTEVDGLADLISAETEAQRKQALLQSTGILSQLYRRWRQEIIKCIAHLEAYIDFAEDEQIEDATLLNLSHRLGELENEIRKHLNDQRCGEILRNGVRTVIIGEPNVGKSSFLNLICQRQISIVTPIAGTTRDVIESPYNICGYPIVFADTAGLRQQIQDPVEREGVSRALNYMQQSDLIILLVDACDLVKETEVTEANTKDIEQKTLPLMQPTNCILSSGNDNFNEVDGRCKATSNTSNNVCWKNITLNNQSWSMYKHKYLERLGIRSDDLKDKILFVIVNKIDLLAADQRNLLRQIDDLQMISCKNSLNVDVVLEAMTETLKKICGQPSSEFPRISQTRYRQYLHECLMHLGNFHMICSPEEKYPDLAIAAQKLRQAVRCIGQITGDVSSEEILDVIFRDFCIGK